MTPLRRWLHWTFSLPAAAVVALALTWGREPGPVVLAIEAVLLVGAVLAAVHHAEVVAHKVGEPFGSLVLAVAVTIIEVALIVTLMLSGKGDTSALARDTVFSAVMLTMNGMVGLSLLVGARRHGMVAFNAEGTGSALATVVTLAGLTLVLPRFTTSEPGPVFSSSQLAFAAIASLILYGLFVFTQTVRHRDFFLPTDSEGGVLDDDQHADPPSLSTTMTSLVTLLLALVAVVGLTKIESTAIEAGVAALGFPQSVVGVVIALLVLLPESIAAVKAASRNRLQTSLNLAYGSAMASIGLTIPTIAVASLWIPGPLALGLEPVHMVLFLISVVIAILTVLPGRAKTLQGWLHLALLASFLFLSVRP
ncbi:MAG: ionic transporter y4hA [Actinobacteria bacterium]|nr:ionic transporter y4hA [Actinomycetota bacterium]